MLFLSSILHAQTKIIFDTDFGGDADDLGAIAMLHEFASRVSSFQVIYAEFDWDLIINGKNLPVRIKVLDSMIHQLETIH